MRPVTLATTDASGGATHSTLYRPDINVETFSVALGVKVTGTVSYTVQHTFDDVWAASFDPSTATWFSHEDLVTKTANDDGNYSFPVRGIRLRQNSGSGSCSMIVIQGG